jgi:hypothetical protein
MDEQKIRCAVCGRWVLVEKAAHFSLEASTCDNATCIKEYAEQITADLWNLTHEINKLSVDSLTF